MITPKEKSGQTEEPPFTEEEEAAFFRMRIYDVFACYFAEFVKAIDGGSINQRHRKRALRINVILEKELIQIGQ